jgi:SNF2 family DNA or RNA helicase
VLAHYDGAANTHGEAMGDVMSRLTVLRMLCDHPELVRRSAAHYAGEGPHTDRTGSLYAWEIREAGLLKTTKKSPKLEATVELITEILEANPRNKVVLFSFFKDALDLLKHATRDLTDSALFTGDLSEPERDRQKRRFQTDPKCRLFLSSDAGGYGVDLPQANYLISYDLPWSAGAWKQRNARIIRLSSEFEKVTLISMLMAGSIEERQYDVLVDKARAASAILDGRGADTKGTLSLDRESLLEFIRASTV